MKTFEKWHQKWKFLWNSWLVSIEATKDYLFILFHVFILEIDNDIDKWPLMGSPVPIIIILVSYLVFVLKVGPQWMSKRPPFHLKKFLVVYNAYQCGFSCWLFSQVSFGPFVVMFRKILTRNFIFDRHLLRISWHLSSVLDVEQLKKRIRLSLSW